MSRQLGRAVVLAVATLGSSVLCVDGMARAASLQFTISNRPATRIGSTHAVAPVPPGFVGTSMDYCAITDYTASPVLARLLLNLAPSGPVVRIGGDGPDQSCPAGPRPIGQAPVAIGALARASGAKLILGLDLDDHSLLRLRSELRALLRAIPLRPYIAAFEIGNEPDAYARYGAQGLLPGDGRHFDAYWRDFTEWAATIRRMTAPDMNIAGPSLIGESWISGAYGRNFDRFVFGPAHPTPITFHTYSLFQTVACPSSVCPAIANLLADATTRTPARLLAGFASRLPPGRALRVDEMNTVTRGGTLGISNTFASALWALDLLFEYLHAGVTGVNVHTFRNAAYQLYSGPWARGWLVFPEYWGLEAFALAAPAQAQLLTVRRIRSAAGVKVWATRAGRRMTVVIINKSLEAHTVALTGSGIPVKATASVGWLRAPPSPSSATCTAGYAASGLCATAGVTLAGAGFGPAGTGLYGGDWTRTGIPDRGPVCSRLVSCTSQPPGGRIVLTVPAGSAAFLSGPPAGANR